MKQQKGHKGKIKKCIYFEEENIIYTYMNMKWYEREVWRYEVWRMVQEMKEHSWEKKRSDGDEDEDGKIKVITLRN